MLAIFTKVPMRTVMLTLLIFPLLLLAQDHGGTNNEFTNGYWFDGKSFVKNKFYSVDGTLKSEKPERVHSVIDLSNKYVIPPFGEAHNHNVAQSSRIEELIRIYIEAGIFYVKNPNSLPRATTPLRGKINVPQAMDVIFSNGGLTASGGHPVELVERNIQRGVWTNEDREGAFYFIINNEADLNRKWDTILAGDPDFIKTYLLYSEEYEKRKGDDSYRGWRGLDPAILPAIVRRAHEASLRVSTHVETATDFHNSLIAGVDEINHLPGFRAEKNDPGNYKNISRYELSEDDARLAARKKVFVVTTVGETIEVLNKIESDSPQAPLAHAVQQLLKRNLLLLAKHNVPIAIGSDQYGGTSLAEATALHDLKIFDNLSLLKMWCETTADAIFPNRRIGRLREGYEASFLVLGADPIQDFSNVKKIEMRVKQGNILRAKEAAVEPMARLYSFQTIK